MACSRRRRRRREDGAVEREVATGPRPRLGRRSFFKIILSDALASGKLGIPKSFLRRCGKDLSNSVLLKVPGGSAWTVELEKCNNDMVTLWKGWREFMEHYSIGHGHLLIFKYKGNSTFRVIIFNKSASEIDYSSSSGKTSYLGRELPSPETEDVVETEHLEDVAAHQRVRIEPHLLYSRLSPGYSTRGSEVPIGTDPEGPNLSQAQAGQTDMNKQPTCRMSHSELVFHGPTLPRPLTTPGLVGKLDSEHPFFKMAIQRSYTNRLYIPGEFFMQHIQEKQRATLRYANRSWSVRLIRGSRRVGGAPYLSFSAGWSAFARETHLHVGNVCVFKLLDRNDIVFEVSILRGGLDFHGPTLSKPVKSSGLASKIDSEHPFFLLVIPRCYINSPRVPVGFAKKHLQENKQMATLRYLDSLWPVKISRSPGWARGTMYLALSTGWRAFARETHLRAGYVCVFELIDRDETVFKVSILSGADSDAIHVD
ncbi:B3 domain-containing transcription factor VRN1-like isoform X2 [Rhodamnia argentea]|uniref:B3 domain-containing transcription factor VRN1-like isoform X2 n=1 Tax=Rhodamnia argentea TaxID=178133 RepID=A0ABM3HD83_9MYRT|nr:B3 domain-containing transcription factor VRN1-like isoform X2 [Rhodamnia argentea]